MYMDNHDDQQDLFQEIVCQLWKSYDSKRKSIFYLDVPWLSIQQLYFKEREKKVDKYEIVSENRNQKLKKVR
jgi:RNA polymerase sigma-70 factor (ECF subfamily)